MVISQDDQHLTKSDIQDEDQMHNKDKGSDTACAPWYLTLKLDLVLVALTSASLYTRLQQLHHPNSVVFDEVFYGRFVSLYLQRTFHFDPQPPLAKLLVAAVGYWVGWDGSFPVETIGAEYPASVPIWWLRLVPAVMGALVVPMGYLILLKLGVVWWGATAGGILLLLDTALLTQCRLLLLEGPLLFFMSATLLCLLNFRSHKTNHSFSFTWWLWLISLGTLMALTLCTKYSGILTLFLVMGVLIRDMWNMLPSPHLSDAHLVQHVCARLCFCVLWPAAVYVAVFYIHLTLLHKAGPHDDIMTSAFQASLQGGLSSITQGQPNLVVYGSQITLRHTYSSAPCWLHSHAAVYPLRYGDGRGSSHQQQVTCYSHKDVNNWWILKDPKKPSLTVDDPIRPIQHGDLVQLVHGMSSRPLNSHDVAAPVSPQLQEVTCYIDYNVSSPSLNLWKVEVVNRDAEDSKWTTIKSHVRLIHVNTSSALKISGRQLPDWGFHQLEVATDKLHDQLATIWNVEEHKYTRLEDAEERERDMQTAPLMPTGPIQLTFWNKFTELQLKMLTSRTSADSDHRYSSTPISWPLLWTNIVYWYNPKSQAQVVLVGNAVVWYAGSVGVLLYLLLLAAYIVARHRGYHPLPDHDWHQLVDGGGLLFTGYFLHYCVYFLMDSTLFLQQYLPALYYKILLLALFLHHLHQRAGIVVLRLIHQVALCVLLLAALHVFLLFSPLCYGTPLTGFQLNALHWHADWHFIHQHNGL